jgi:hypothetical protein
VHRAIQHRRATGLGTTPLNGARAITLFAPPVSVRRNPMRQHQRRRCLEPSFARSVIIAGAGSTACRMQGCRYRRTLYFREDV